MKFTHIIWLFSCLLSFNLLAQTPYDELPLADKISVKEGHTPYFTNSNLGKGINPTIQSTGPEQQCNSAIPVCQNIYSTTTSYSGNGSSQEIPGNTCLGSNELNSVWYTFTSSSAGNIAFNITPNVLGQDYDFALYNITGTNCSAISSGALTPVRCNFAATGGVTGLSSSGTNASEPASGSNQSTVLATAVGQTYVLIISNYSSSANGYQLNFTPGTASIFDVTPPTITGVTAPCGSNVITFNASEQITCNTIAADGSDFTVTGTGGPYVVTAASGLNCGVNTAQINLTTSPALSGAGPWTVGVTTGSDGNTLIDLCGNVMAPQTRTFTTVPPTASVSGPSSVCKGSTFALTASSASSYTWTGAAVPAGQQNQQTITITANNAGNLNFTVNVSNGTCGNSVVTKAVTVTDAPIANFTALPSLTVCAGTPITFTNTSTYPCSTGGLGINQCNCGAFLCNTTSNQGTFATYLWTFGNGATAFYLGGSPAANFSPVYTYTAPGTYNVSLNASGLINTCSNTKNLTVTVLPAAASLTVSPTTTICPGQSSTLTATGGTSYTWTPATNLNTTSGGTVVATPPTTTIYSVTSPGCSGTQTRTIQVVVGGTPPAIGAINGLTSICPNQTGVTYSVANVAGTNYTWTVPSGASITSAPTNSNVITVNFGATAGTVSVTASGLCGTVSASIAVTTTVVAPPIGNVTGPGSVCPNQTAVTYSVNNVGGATYSWQLPPGASITSAPTNSNAITVDFGATAGSITAIAVTACGSATSIVVVAVTPNPTITMPPSTTVCPGQSVILTITGAGSYTWAPGNSLSATTGSVVTASPTVTTIYSVSTDGCGSPVTGTVEIAVSGDPPNIGLVDGPTTICSNATTGLSYSVANIPGTTYSWSVPPGATITSSPINTNSITMNMGTNSGSVIVNAVNACGTATSIVTVNLAPNPTITVTPDQSICPGESAFLAAGGAATFTWMPGNITTQTISVNPTSTTIYTVTGDNGICTSTNTIQVTPIPNPTLSISPNATVCSGTPATLTVNGASNYTWTPSTFLNNNNTASVVSTPTSSITYTVNGSTGTASNTCVSSRTVQITVIPNAIATVSPKDSVCLGSSTVMFANGGNTYNWLPTTGLTNPNNSVTTASPNSTTIYTVTVSTNGLCPGTATVEIFVNPLPTISVNSATICVGQQTATLTANGADTYTWSPGLSPLTGSVVTGNPASTQSYTVAGTDLNGCINRTVTTIAVNPLPTIAVSPNATVCPSAAITLTASGAASYTWSPNIYLNNNNTSSVVCTPSVTTTYTIDGLSSAACSNSAVVTVVSSNTLVVTASSDATICPLGSATISASGATTYTWSPSLTLNSANNTTVIATPITSTTYTVFGSSSTCTNSVQVVVTVTNNPVISLAANPPIICSGSTSALTASGASTYTWSPSTTLNSANGATVNANPLNPTTYNVSGTSTLGCTSFTTITLDVVTTPTLSAIGNPNPLTICAGKTATLSAFGATNYTWTPSSLNNVNGSPVIATPSATTIYTVTGSNGAASLFCYDTRTIQVIVTPNTTVTPGESVIICLGKSSTIYASGGLTYSWTPNTGLSSPNDSITLVTPSSAGVFIYTITATNNNNCPGSAVVQVTVNPLPIVNAGMDTTINIDNTVTLFGTGNVEVGFVNGSDGIPLSCNYCPTITVNPQNSVCYTLEGINSFGCRSTDEVCVTVTKDWDVFIPNAFTPNGDINNEFFIPVGYGISEIKLTIFDRWGHVIFKSNDETIGWDGKNKGQICEQGVYIYQAEIKAMSGATVKKTGHVTLLPRLK